MEVDEYDVVPRSRRRHQYLLRMRCRGCRRHGCCLLLKPLPSSQDAVHLLVVDDAEPDAESVADDSALGVGSGAGVGTEDVIDVRESSAVSIEVDVEDLGPDGSDGRHDRCLGGSFGRDRSRRFRRALRYLRRNRALLI